MKSNDAMTAITKLLIKKPRTFLELKELLEKEYSETMLQLAIVNLRNSDLIRLDYSKKYNYTP